MRLQIAFLANSGRDLEFQKTRLLQEAAIILNSNLDPGHYISTVTVHHSKSQELKALGLSVKCDYKCSELRKFSLVSLVCQKVDG
ncbi:hypothetical protein AVEN_173488-1 [Araneus ventricosus]|uniref:Uncharacterized protein n=1 Tax=Araneus ventricosus TaxID=182803 RepID=A0A4Y2KIJ7_ARAVE|nr:hypothetical protein AVEN_173488-1 [Araneus ventricosus]